MSSPFASAAIWQQGTFVFIVHSSPVAVDARGNASSPGRAIAVTFKLRPTGGGVRQTWGYDKATIGYEGRIVAVDGDYSKTLLPPELKPGDVGAGSIRGVACHLLIKDISQSSVSPIVEPLLGSKVTLEVTNAIARGNKV